MATRLGRYEAFTSPVTTTLSSAGTDAELAVLFQNQLPTPAPSDSSRNASPHAGPRRPFETLELSALGDALSSATPSRPAYGTASDMYSISSHEIAISTPPSDRTNAFFTSSSTQYKLPTPPHRHATLPSRDSHSSAKSADLFRSASDRRTSDSRSTTDDFFASNSPRPPSPPPAVTHVANASAPAPVSMPLLSRLFPSRYRRSRDEIEDNEPSTSCHAPLTATSLLSPPHSPLPVTTPESSPPKSHVRSGEHEIHREPHHIPYTSNEPEPGSTYEAEDIQLTYLRRVGSGAFSSVWLARDDKGSLSHDDRPHERRPSESVARRRRDRKMEGLRPTAGPSNLHFTPTRLPAMQLTAPLNNESAVDMSDDSDYAMADQYAGLEQPDVLKHGRLVAVKMMDLALCHVNDRTRISFVREVEVLRHISHPNIVSYLHSFTTSQHHCLVLEYIGGGELFELVNSGDNFSRMTEDLLRRMWGELALAVGWMHNVSLVHRDIKLENIMLTCNPFALTSSPIDLSYLPSPLIKLTDFGLSRFIDPANPLLTTRCGSEFYSAPEIIMAQPYDGRRTDAWACGVVLFALATRVLPFDADNTRLSPIVADGQASPTFKRDTKRSYMLRIAKGEYHWPGEATLRRSSSGGSSSRRSSMGSSDEGHHQNQNYWSSSSYSTGLSLSTSPPASASSENPRFSVSSDGHGASTSAAGDEDSSTHSQPSSTLATEGVRRIVSRLLVRDPRKRARIVDLWTDDWMKGPGAPLPPPEAFLEDEDDVTPGAAPPSTAAGGDGNGEDGDGDWVPPENNHRRSTSGRLVLKKGDSIPIVARQEVIPP